MMLTRSSERVPSAVRRCSVCAHQDLAWINEQLQTEPPNWRAMARQLGLSRQALHRHAMNHPLEETEPINLEDPMPPSKRLEEAEAKGVFLGAFKTSGDFDGSAETAGVSRLTVRKWVEHDEAFGFRFNQTRAELVEHLEATAIERATNGGRMVRRIFRGGHLYEETHEWRPSDAALIKLLSSLKPEVYGDKLQVTQTSIVKAVDADAWQAV